MYENCADNLSNNLRLNEISILILLQFYCKINKNQLEIVVWATYGLYPYSFEILNLKFWSRSLVAKRFGFHSNSRGADEIKNLLILIDFQVQSCYTELLLLFSIMSLWSDILCSSSHMLHIRSSRSQMLFKISILKNFAIFTGKHLCWDHYLIKLQAFRPTTLLKRLQHRCFHENNEFFFCFH